MLSRTKAHLRAVEDEIADVAKQAKAIIETASKEGRSRTDEENAQIADFHKKLDVLKDNKRDLEDQYETEKSIEDSVKDAGREEGAEIKNGLDSIKVGQTRVKTLGEQFVESEGFKNAIAAKQAGAQQFSTGGIKIETKAGTLFEGSQGAGFIPVPQVTGGVVEKLFQRLTVADLLPTGTANSNSIRYIVEGTATSGATGVAEGAAKPASDLALSPKDETVTKIATSLTVSDEMLEDAAQVQSYVNGRLSLFVKIEEERELLRGAGSSSNELTGILDSSRGINAYARGTVDSNAVALFKVLNGTRGSSFLEPDAIILHPDNWQTTRLSTDSAGQFFGGGPFLGPYGGPQGPVGTGAQVTGGALDSLWGKPVVVTTAIGSGTALVGSFMQAAQFFRRGGLTVEASNGYQDYFLKNLVAIRAEERGALAVYRPSAFTKVTGLN